MKSALGAIKSARYNIEFIPCYPKTSQARLDDRVFNLLWSITPLVLFVSHETQGRVGQGHDLVHDVVCQYPAQRLDSLTEHKCRSEGTFLGAKRSAILGGSLIELLRLTF